MEQRIVFREMLSEIRELADTKGNRMTREEVDAFFAHAGLEPEQMQLIYEYLKSQKIEVNEGSGAEQRAVPEPLSLNGSRKSLDDILAGFGLDGTEPGELGGEENREGPGSLELYLKELKKLKKSDPRTELQLFSRSTAGDVMARQQLTEIYLPLVCELVSEYDGTQCLPEDLIQEGNMGLWLTLEQMEAQENLSAYQVQLLNGINKAIQNAIREQTDSREQGDAIARRVNRLSDAIRDLQEELETGISVEELSAYLEMPAEEIIRVMKMAGDELKIDGYGE